jgi:tRNA pseudouridine38-40 synthase
MEPTERSQLVDSGESGNERVRLRLDVAYDGSEFAGWATQPGQRTVEGVLGSTLERILRRLPGSTRLTVAGRTDAGVHARGQVCHVDVPPDFGDVEALGRRLNRALPADVVVRRVVTAPAGFNARFSASWRRYAYRVCDLPHHVDPIRRREVLAWPRPLDEAAMNEAAAGLLGEHDFAAFCRRREGASTVRHLRELSWRRDGGLLTCHVLADAFCHNMVRSLVGCLIVIGEARQPASWAAEVLAARVRDPRVPVVAAHGLTLEQVGYPCDARLRLAPQAEASSPGVQRSGMA